MPTETINGIEIHYRDVGAGFPVVLLHGYTGNSRNWALTVPALRDRFRVISPDHRGHGLSGKPRSEDAYSLPEMADDVYKLLHSLGIHECYLVGHSMGGMIAQYVVLEHPELVRALVLEDTAPETLPMRNEYRNKLLALAREEGMEAAFEEQLRLNPDPRLIANPQYVHLWREQFLMTGLDAYIACGQAMATRESLVGRLHEITVPTLIICGERDEPFLAPSRVMHEAIPGSEFVIIEGAGHGPQMETPAEFNRVLTSFLARVHEETAASV
jgi:2-succinyl-6-hydroxy-2,4-cyclohexadiene-1-carboxylate synthase